MKGFAGIDGCRGGWIAVIFDDSWKACLYKNIQCYWDNNKHIGLVLIDIPIGLKGDRDCDKLARKMLPASRKSTIFNTPAAECLDIEDYKKASQINYDICGKRLSKQSFYLMPKIREVDDFLDNSKEARKVFYESHPELCFLSIPNKDFYNKKGPHGRQQRLEFIKNIEPGLYDVYKWTLNRYKRILVESHDILDAMILAISAKAGKNKLRFLPRKAKTDSRGLKMQIAYSVWDYYI